MAIGGQGRREAKRLGEKSPDRPKAGRRAQALYTPSHPIQHAGHGALGRFGMDGKEKRRDEKAVQRARFQRQHEEQAWRVGERWGSTDGGVRCSYCSRCMTYLGPTGAIGGGVGKRMGRGMVRWKQWRWSWENIQPGDPRKRCGAKTPRRQSEARRPSRSTRGLARGRRMEARRRLPLLGLHTDFARRRLVRLGRRRKNQSSELNLVDKANPPLLRFLAAQGPTRARWLHLDSPWPAGSSAGPPPLAPKPERLGGSIVWFPCERSIV
jgi:hypothetical protein